MKKIKSVFLSFFLILCLTACSGSSFDAAGYTKACLDATLRGEYAEYAKLTDRSEEEAKKEIEDENIYGTFVNTMTAGLDSAVIEEWKPKYEELIKQIFAQCKYEVGEASENEDGSYSVPVTTQKMNNVFSQLYDDAEEQLTDYVKKSKKTPSDSEIEAKLLQLLYDDLTEKSNNITYDEPQTITVTVRPTADNDRIYEISEEDFSKLYEALLDF
ncbi:MAG: hypothetical protein J1F02_04245 [Lachnospiraceae bacterium]|nr:hypothetical protein [Lachnospiraceae bacterium]